MDQVEISYLNGDGTNAIGSMLSSNEIRLTFFLTNANDCENLK